MGDLIDIVADDEHRLQAYLAVPAGSPRGGLVVVQTAFGVDDYLCGVCDAYAADGYAAIAPALYDRQQRGAVLAHDTAGMQAAQILRSGFVWAETLRDIEAARSHVARFGRVGVIGFCVGGSVAWLSAQSLSFAAAASYYGKDVVEFLDRAPKCPTILHFGDADRLIPISDVERIRAAFPDIPNFLYNAGHGFDANVPEAARIARERTLGLMRQHVG